VGLLESVGLLGAKGRPAASDRPNGTGEVCWLCRRAGLPVVPLGGTNASADSPNYADFIGSSEDAHSLP
jgi:hypothetical protein